ncbi:MAG: lipoyl(octanoyl) transferase LipB [Arenicella sp.]|nr:lipoyl(octanoyl) transferase LipB [Arenicella sp.]
MKQPVEQFSLRALNGREIEISKFDQVPYQESYEAMASFAKLRSEQDHDQIWLLQHPPVYTQGTACNLNTLLPSDIALVKTDRGGQITYHGPGQIVMYPMLALKQYSIGVKALVSKLEQSMIDTLFDLGIEARRRDDAPGVYVGGSKIGALGLRIRKGTSYHGLSLNVNMDLSPFNNIDPCGYQGLKVTNIVDHSPEKVDVNDVANTLLKKFISSL